MESTFKVVGVRPGRSRSRRSTFLAVALTAAGVALAAGLALARGGGKLHQPYPHSLLLGPGVRVGYGVTEIDDGKTIGVRTTVVGETEKAWQIELRVAFRGGRLAEDVQGLTVDKATGRVTHAVMGKAGHRGRELSGTPDLEKAFGLGAQFGAPEHATVKERTVLSLEGHRYAVDQYRVGKDTYSVARGGPLDGLELRRVHGDEQDLTVRNIHEVTCFLGDRSVQAVELTQDHGAFEMGLTLTRDPVVRALNPWPGVGSCQDAAWGHLAWTLAGTTTRLTAIETDAKPALVW